MEVAMSSRVSRLTIAAILILSAGAARAEGPGDDPTVIARAFASLPAGVAVAIEPRDDNDLNLHLRDVMATRLAAHNHPVVAGAALRVRFSSEAMSNVSPRAGAATGEALVARDRKPFSATNLDYSEADRFFGGPSERALGAIQNSYQVRATLEARDGGRVLWRGQATGALNDRNEQRLAAALAEALADTVGQTADS